MFYTEFDDIVPDRYKSVDLFPEQLRAEIESTNDWTYNDINNGVYKSGFATYVVSSSYSHCKIFGHKLTIFRTQEAYEQAVKPLFASLDRAEAHLTKHAGPYYFGTNITEVDVRLYTTIIRFDPVYVQHFKCNIRDIRSGYPELHKWLRKLYWDVPAFKDTTQFEHIKNHYTKSHKQINSFVRLLAAISCCVTISDWNNWRIPINTEYYASRATSRHLTQRPRDTGCSCGTPVDEPMIRWLPWQTVQGEDLIQNLQSQSDFDSTVVHVHTIHGEALITMRNSMRLMMFRAVHVLGDSIPRQTTINDRSGQRFLNLRQNLFFMSLRQLLSISQTLVSPQALMLFLVLSIIRLTFK